MHEQPNRREFLTSTTLAGAGWLALRSGLLAGVAACAREDAATGAAFTTLTDDQGRTLRAFATRILPSGDGLPGAEEAGAVHFIDRVLGSVLETLRDPVAAAAADLDRRAGAAVPGTASFADLDAETQIAVLREAEQEGWFGVARFLVLAGVFSDPSWGGGRDDARFRIYGIEHAPGYTPPFGYYDAEGGAA